jgi:pilus assembly protein Flp/PilA
MLTIIEMTRMVLRSKKGQGMAEYGLILALVAIASAAAFTTMSGGLNTLLGTVNTELTQ